MQNSIFYRLTWPQIKGEVCLKTEKFLNPDPLLLLTGQIKIEMPLNLKKYAGNKWMDFVTFGDAINYAVSQKVIDLLIENKISGWSAYNIIIEDTNLQYYGFCITGNPVPFIKNLNSGKQSGYLFEIDNWDESDFFTFKNTGHKICTEKVKKLFLKYNITNISFENIADIEYYNS